VSDRKPVGLTEKDVHKLVTEQLDDEEGPRPCQCGHNYGAHDRHGRCWDCECNRFRDA